VAALRQRWRPGPRLTLDLGASYARPVRAVDNSIWAWAERGYPLVAESGVPATIAGPVRRASQVQFDLGLHVTLASWSSLRVEGFWRRHDDLTLVERALSIDPVDRSFSGPAHVTTDGGGQVAGGLITAEAHAERLAFRIGYRHQRSVAGEDRFRAAEARLPRHRIRYSLEFTPADGLDLWSMLEYRSATHWREYEAVEAATGGEYRAQVPASVGIDVAIQKWLWKRRLRAHLGFRNLLGSTLRYHPAGATVGPRMYVQFEAHAP
jgi:hypothetical protein